MIPSSPALYRAALIASILCLVLFVMKLCSPAPSEQQRKELTSLEAQARQAMLARLQHPETAQFRSLSGRCGEVSYRSDNGVDVGFRRFVLLDSQHVMVDLADSRVEFGLVWGSKCG